jgi:hypothetical protein
MLDSYMPTGPLHIKIFIDVGTQFKHFRIWGLGLKFTRTFLIYLLYSNQQVFENIIFKLSKNMFT